MSSRRRVLAMGVLAAFAGVGHSSVLAESREAGDAEAGVRELLAQWYSELRKPRGGAPWRLLAPMAIHESCRRATDDMSAALPIEPYAACEMAAHAGDFRYRIDGLVVADPLARADVWEFGAYPLSGGRINVMAKRAVFLLEDTAGGGCRVRGRVLPCRAGHAFRRRRPRAD